jgi:2-polyprenyl-6-methoxyphenol hydroxylase-like FAD-dependent oxidoreductase
VRDSPVVIAGGGPVGMTLALELAHHGVRSILLERNPSTTKHPKMDLTNGRSMELFRRLGLADKLRAVGVPADRPLDVLWATNVVGHELHRFRYPSPDEARAQTLKANDGTRTLEPCLRISQVVLEPVLKRAVDENPFVDVRFGCALESFNQDSSRVVVSARETSSRRGSEISCAYLVGCDGGGSRVRHEAGITMEGQFAVASAYMIHFRSDAREVLLGMGDCYHLQTSLGTLIVQNGYDIWTFQGMLPPGTDPSSIDAPQLLRQFVGRDFEFEILVANPWTPHMVVAEAYRVGRVFLAGDSAHQVIPTGGYGMNTGIGDAVDLGWKLAAFINGWGGEALLDSYAAERHPIALQNRAAALRHAQVRVAITMAIVNAETHTNLNAQGSLPARSELGGTIKALGNAENESWGIEHGYAYERSPVVMPDESPLSPFDPLTSVPTSRPGARLPHIVIAGGTPLYELLGPEMTLLVVGDVALGNVERDAAAAGVPLTIAHLQPERATQILGKKLLLVRPDQHVAWRADAAPQQWQTVFACITGQVPHAED